MLMAFISAGRLLTWHIKAKMAQLPLSSGICKLKENFEFSAQLSNVTLFKQLLLLKTYFYKAPEEMSG